MTSGIIVWSIQHVSIAACSAKLRSVSADVFFYWRFARYLSIRIGFLLRAICFIAWYCIACNTKTRIMDTLECEASVLVVESFAPIAGLLWGIEIWNIYSERCANWFCCAMWRDNKIECFFYWLNSYSWNLNFSCNSKKLIWFWKVWMNVLDINYSLSYLLPPL